MFYPPPKMDYNYYLNHIITEGIEAAKRDYKEGDKLDGSIAGFEACRGLKLPDLYDLLKSANEYMEKAFREEHDNYWYFRCYQAEIEFVIGRMKTYVALSTLMI